MHALTAVGRRGHAFTSVAMDTGITIQVVTHKRREDVEADVQHALAWFDLVERSCSRFDPASEVLQLLQRIDEPVTVSTLLFEAVAFALDLAELSGGAFDPTIGAHMEHLGFLTNYRTGEIVANHVSSDGVSFRNVELDRRQRSITLRRPIVLDLNAVAKGLAIDLAAQELREYADVCVEAGGDLYVRGRNTADQPWRVGIQHPRAEGLLDTLSVRDSAVCTSGDYERRGHLVDARSHTAPTDLASVTVVAPTAMAADGLSTAAMLLGCDRGRQLLQQQGVGGLLVAPDGKQRRINM
jgi:thiamine biosynthesis lipoprotein